MPKFKFTKKLMFANLGEEWKEYFNEEWKDCYMVFEVKTPMDSIKLQSEKKGEETSILDFVKSKFVSGKGIVDGQTVEISSDDLADMPENLLFECMKVIQGIVDPK